MKKRKLKFVWRCKGYALMLP